MVSKAELRSSQGVRSFYNNDKMNHNDKMNGWFRRNGKYVKYGWSVQKKNMKTCINVAFCTVCLTPQQIRKHITTALPKEMCLLLGYVDFPTVQHSIAFQKLNDDISSTQTQSFTLSLSLVFFWKHDTATQRLVIMKMCSQVKSPLSSTHVLPNSQYSAGVERESGGMEKTPLIPEVLTQLPCREGAESRKL